MSDSLPSLSTLAAGVRNVPHFPLEGKVFKSSGVWRSVEKPHTSCTRSHKNPKVGKRKIFSDRSCTNRALSRLLRPSWSWSIFLVGTSVSLYVARPFVSFLHSAIHALSACILHHLLRNVFAVGVMDTRKSLWRFTWYFLSDNNTPITYEYNVKRKKSDM